MRKTCDFFLDFLFPKKCVGCGKEGEWLCKKCENKIIRVASFVCPRCNCLTEKGQFCSSCRLYTNLTGVLASAYYDQGPLKEIIWSYKYEYIIDLHNILSDLLIGCLIKKPFPVNSIIIPVPLHKKRKRQRGFNQSELLARDISLRINLEMKTDILERHKLAVPQMKLSGGERRKNVCDVFSCINQDVVVGKIIILVDDVATTLATLEECAKVLRALGARQIWGLVVARQL